MEIKPTNISIEKTQLQEYGSGITYESTGTYETFSTYYGGVSGPDGNAPRNVEVI